NAASQKAILGEKVAVIANSARACSRMGAGRKRKAAIIKVGISAPAKMPCEARSSSNRGKLCTAGTTTDSTSDTTSMLIRKRRIDRVMANQAAKGIAASSPAEKAVVSQEISSRAKPSPPCTSTSASPGTRLTRPAIMAATNIPNKPTTSRLLKAGAAVAAGAAGAALLMPPPRQLAGSAGNSGLPGLNKGGSWSSSGEYHAGSYRFDAE